MRPLLCRSLSQGPAKSVILEHAGEALQAEKLTCTLPMDRWLAVHVRRSDKLVQCPQNALHAVRLRYGLEWRFQRTCEQMRRLPSRHLQRLYRQRRMRAMRPRQDRGERRRDCVRVVRRRYPRAQLWLGQLHRLPEWHGGARAVKWQLFVL